MFLRSSPRLRLAFIGLLVLAAGVLMVTLVWMPLSLRAGVRTEPPAEAVKQYVTSYYARDYARVYDLLSEADQHRKSREAYLRENSSFSGFALQLAYRLASFIEFNPLSTAVQGDAATVTMKLREPDGNAPAVQKILMEADRTANLPSARQQELIEALEQLHRSREIPMLDVEQEFQLSRGTRGWGIATDTSQWVRVRFSGTVQNGLPWEIVPVQDEILARPGETLQAFYRVKNLADHEVTGRAIHTIEPKAYEQYLETIQCFCFIRQTLKPGEEQLMKLIFRVAWDVPAEVKEFGEQYEFYPIESAPDTPP